MSGRIILPQIQALLALLLHSRRHVVDCLKHKTDAKLLRSVFGASPESIQLLPLFTACMTFSLDISTNRFKAVPDQSSSFDSRKHGSDTIHANHMNMCRLNAKDDDGYEKFSGVLEKYIGQIRNEKNEANKVRRESQS